MTRRRDGLSIGKTTEADYGSVQTTPAAKNHAASIACDRAYSQGLSIAEAAELVDAILGGDGAEEVRQLRGRS